MGSSGDLGVGGVLEVGSKRGADKFVVEALAQEILSKLLVVVTTTTFFLNDFLYFLTLVARTGGKDLVDEVIINSPLAEVETKFLGADAFVDMSVFNKITSKISVVEVAAINEFGDNLIDVAIRDGGGRFGGVTTLTFGTILIFVVLGKIVVVFTAELGGGASVLDLLLKGGIGGELGLELGVAFGLELAGILFAFEVVANLLDGVGARKNILECALVELAKIGSMLKLFELLGGQDLTDLKMIIGNLSEVEREAILVVYENVDATSVAKGGLESSDSELRMSVEERYGLAPLPVVTCSQDFHGE